MISDFWFIVLGVVFFVGVFVELRRFAKKRGWM